MANQPPWLLLAYAEMEEAVVEVVGPNHNPRIVAYHNETSLKATDDETFWCSSFVCSMFEWTGIPSTRSAAARSWLQWGDQLNAPRTGCVVVLWRGSRTSTSGHCGFYVGETATHVQLLGGNQENKVCVRGYPKEQVLGYRWPSREVRVSDGPDSSGYSFNN